jgi:periplasmic copper chaperone A
MKRWNCFPYLIASLLALASWAAQAHGSKVGDIRIDHPYATPTRPGMTTGAVYFRSLSNTGKVEDRLVSASTPAAARVELHRMQMQGNVMRMAAVPAVALPAGVTMPMKHGSHDGHHLMLFDLTAPLKDGDRFPLTLTFEKAGTVQVQVWVQTPRPGSGSIHQHP